MSGRGPFDDPLVRDPFLAEREAAQAFNRRLLQLAEHNGYEIRIRPGLTGELHWELPASLVPIAGFQVAVLR